MYELVIIHNAKEEVIFFTEDIREADLKRSQHIRSFAHGYADVRNVTVKEKKKKVVC